MFKRRQKVLTPGQMEEIRTKDFFDMVLPGVLKFQPDHYILGDSYRCVWAIREYPPSTEEQAILSQLADRGGVTLEDLLLPPDSPSLLGNDCGGGWWRHRSSAGLSRTPPAGTG